MRSSFKFLLPSLFLFVLVFPTCSKSPQSVKELYFNDIESSGALQPLGHSFIVVSPVPSRHVEFEFDPYFLIDRTPHYSGLVDRVNVIHVQDLYPDSFTNKLPRYIRGVLNLPLIYLDRPYLVRAAKDVVIFRRIANKILVRRKVKSDNIQLIYNWQEETEFFDIDPSKTNGKKFTFTYLGNIGTFAGMETLIRAFIKSPNSNSTVFNAGNGASKEHCMKIGSESNVDIRFMTVPSDQIAAVQAGSDVLLLSVIKCGTYSSIPSKFPAYTFSSKSILATLDTDSDTARAIIDANCGWVGEAEDIDWLAQKVGEVEAWTGRRTQEPWS